ncbi:MAG: 2-oxoacid:acceptor oxidoreductase subunit alpha [Candidatus Sumerlaeia bacterium]|nr:2-oxoacid:acceptor oxidoreductase subunit alpha [Candidatus Sumerlaeia bacterium]
MSQNKEWRLLSGNEACAKGALLAGCRFFAGYPITPSSEIAEMLAEELPRIGGVFIQMEDEIASMGAIIGASLVGVKAMTATSGPGFSLKQENLGFASFCEIPCVVVNVMRGGPSTGQPTFTSQADVMQARWGTHGDHPTIALCPNSVEETLFLTIEAFNMAEKYREPVILLLDEVIGHMREKAWIPKPEEITLVSRKKPDSNIDDYQPFAETDDCIPPLAAYGEGIRFHITGLTHDVRGYPTNRADEATQLLTRLQRKIELHKKEMCKYEQLFLEPIPDILVVAYGSTARVAKRAVKIAREQGISVGLLRLITIWPFPDFLVRELAKRVKALIVPEQNQGQLIGEVERCVFREIPIIGVHKFDGFMMEPGQILNAITEVKY